MTGLNPPFPEPARDLLAEADLAADPTLVGIVGGIARLGEGPEPDASAALAQLMADGGKPSRPRRTKGRITFIGGALAVSMGVGMSGVAAGTAHLQDRPDGALTSAARFSTPDHVDGLTPKAVSGSRADSSAPSASDAADVPLVDPAPQAITEGEAPSPGLGVPSSPHVSVSPAMAAPAPSASFTVAPPSASFTVAPPSASFTVAPPSSLAAAAPSGEAVAPWTSVVPVPSEGSSLVSPAPVSGVPAADAVGGRSNASTLPPVLPLDHRFETREASSEARRSLPEPTPAEVEVLAPSTESEAMHFHSASVAGDGEWMMLFSVTFTELPEGSVAGADVPDESVGELAEEPTEELTTTESLPKPFVTEPVTADPVSGSSVEQPSVDEPTDDNPE